MLRACCAAGPQESLAWVSCLAFDLFLLMKEARNLRWSQWEAVLAAGLASGWLRHSPVGRGLPSTGQAGSGMPPTLMGLAGTALPSEASYRRGWVQGGARESTENPKGPRGGASVVAGGGQQGSLRDKDGDRRGQRPWGAIPVSGCAFVPLGVLCEPPGTLLF